MDTTRFDRWTRTLATKLSRRRTLVALLMSSVVLSRTAEDSAAGPGCKNVGKKCKKAKDCCSGVCKGKKGKKTCKAHDTGGCPPGGTCDAVMACTTSEGEASGCLTTTGNAGYCGASLDCHVCAKDADCRALCGPRAACGRCAGKCPATGDTFCMGPGKYSCFWPRRW